jgi:fatty acid CoA ligase FadD9
MDSLIGSANRLNHLLGCRPKIKSVPRSLIRSITDRIAAQPIREKFKNTFGGRVQFFVTGGAPTSAAVKSFIHTTYGITIFDGYGITETGGISNDNYINQGVKVKLEDVPDMGYLRSDKPCPRGEILVKTDYLTQGYYKNSEATRSSFTEDGYFRTGDIGMMHSDGRVEIIDRKKHLIKLSQGEFVAPESLEGLFLECPFISQIYIDANSNQAFVVAVVSLAASTVFGWARSNGIESNSLAELARTDALKQKILEELVSFKHRLQPFEIPKNVYLTEEQWTTDNNLLTPSFKLRRPALSKHYREQVVQLYNELENLEQNLMQMLARVNGIDVEQLASVEAISGDSLSTVRLVNMVRDKFNKEIPFSVAQRGVADIVEYMNTGVMPRDQLFEQDLYSAPPAWSNVPPAQPGFAVVFLTGVTGFLGIYLLRELLAQSDVERVYCLVRARSEEQAMLRIAEQMQHTGTPLNDEQRSRIGIVLGDLSLPRLGVVNELYDILASEVQAIYHCGAYVNWIHPYSLLRLPNVLGTRAVAELAVSTCVKPLHFISSIGVADWDNESNLLDFSLIDRVNAYSLTKYANEVMLRKMCNAGLPVTFARPGMITGASDNGFCNKTDYVNRYLRAIVQMKCAIDNPMLLDMTPVDYVARVCVLLSREASSVGRTFHIVNPSPLSYSRIGVFAQSWSKHSLPLLPYFGELECVEILILSIEWRAELARLAGSDPSHPLYALMSLFPESYFSLGSERPAVHSNTDDLLNQLHAPGCPRADEALLHRYLDANQ